jgi:hypothetical protein
MFGGCVAYEVRPTRFGRIHVPEPAGSLTRMHLAATEQITLVPITHDLRVPVLDQEDLLAQGINTAQIVPGAAKVDALGSCVANASTAALSAGLTPAQADRLLPPGAPRLTGDDPADGEKWAIWLYHGLTMLTGQPGTEWPPQDCGSSGLYACEFLEHQGLIAGHQIAHGAENILSLMQTAPLITGQPWLNAWMNPDSSGFIDGDGSMGQLAEDAAGGVAGGHETCWYAIEQIGRTLDGTIDPATTIIRFRNSWGTGWGDQGTGLAHLSTFVALGHWCDFRAFTFAA